MNRPDDQSELGPHRGPGRSGIPLPEEWLGHARDLARLEDAPFRTSRANRQAWGRFWTPERRVEAEEQLGRVPSQDEWSALNAAIRSMGLLTQLPREGAPAELEGRVVASLHAGHRQSRAAEYVGSLPSMRAPAELDEIVAQRLAQQVADAGVDLTGGLASAPSELDERVAEALARPEESLVRGMASRLESVDAPQELDQRVDRSLADRPALDGDAVPVGRSVVVWGSAALAVAAAVLFMIVGSRAADVDGGASEFDRQAAAKTPPASGRTAGRVYPEFTIRRPDPSSVKQGDRQVLGIVGATDFGGRG